MDRVLILDGMWNKSLAVVRSFGSKGFHVTAGERTRFATALFSKYCNKRFIYPSPLGQRERFFECLENELIRGDYDAVFPMEYYTQELLTQSANRERIEKYARLPYADAELAERINDKTFVMRYALDNGIDIPKTYFAQGPEQVSNIADEITYPVLIKPRVSSGSRGIMYVKDMDALLSSYLKVHANYPRPLIQEHIPLEGNTYGVGLLLNSSSEVRASFVYKRLRTYPVKGGPSTLRESVKRDDIKEIAEYLMKTLKWIGVAHVEFKIDVRDEKPKLLEINPRFWGSLQLAIESGVDFPFLLYKLAMEGDIEPVKDYAVGVKCRWLLPGDLMHFLKNPDRFRLNPSFFDFRIKDDIISAGDPMPTFGRMSSLLTLIYDKDMRRTIKR